MGRDLSTPEKLASGNPAVRREGRREAAKQSASQRSKTVSKARDIAGRGYTGTVTPSQVTGPSASQIQQAKEKEMVKKVATQQLQTKAAAVRTQVTTQAAITRAAPEGYQFPTATTYTPLTKAELAEKKRMTYGVGAKGFLARGSEKYRTDYPFDPKVPVSLAFGVGKIGYGAATFVKGIVTKPITTIKETGKGLFSLVKEPTKAGYAFREYAAKKPFEAVGQVLGAVLISKGVKKVTGVGKTKVARKFGDVELKPSKIAYKTRVVKTSKGTELKGTAYLKGKAETYYPFKIKGKAKIVSRAKPRPETYYLFKTKGKAKIVSRATPKVYAMKRPGGTFSEAFGEPGKIKALGRKTIKVYSPKRPGGTFSEAFGEPGKVKVFGQKTIKLFRRESDVALKFKIKGTPKEFVGKGKGMVGKTRFTVKSAAPAYVKGMRTAEIYDIKTGKRYFGKGFSKLTRGAETRTKLVADPSEGSGIKYVKMAKKPGLKQEIGKGRRVAMTQSVFKIRPTGKKEVVLASKEVIYGREALKKGRYGIGYTKGYETFWVKEPPIRQLTKAQLSKLPREKVLYAWPRHRLLLEREPSYKMTLIKGKETFAKGFGRVSAETLPRKGAVQQLAKAKLRGYLPKQVRLAGITGVGLEPPTTILIPPKTRPSVSYLSGIRATAKDIAKGAVYVTPKVGIGGLGVIPALRQVPKTQPAIKPIQRPRVRPRARLGQKPIVREIITPKVDVTPKVAPRIAQRQFTEQVVRPKLVPEQKLLVPGKTPRLVPQITTPVENGFRVKPYRPLRKAYLKYKPPRTRVTITQPKEYAPTLRATFLGIKTKKKPKGILTGFGERPIVKFK